MSKKPQDAANSAIHTSACAAEFLEGTELANGWKVISKVQQNTTATGGKFSISYVVERKAGKTTNTAFLKVLNLRQALSHQDPLREIQRLTTSFNFERETLTLCKNKRLKRVAMLIEDGQYTLSNSQFPVFYIIIELAEGGNLRQQIARFKTLDIAWTLRTLHHIAVGVMQLHTQGIAHQDIKPSNILFFEKFGAKIGDLGSADHSSVTNPRGQLQVAGDLSYAPPELLYNELSHDRSIRRIGCDFYLLGSLVVFFFAGGSSMTAAILKHLHPDHKPFKWPHDYRAALPYVRNAFEQAIESVKTDIPEAIQPKIVGIIRYLCDPDPQRRGHPHNTTSGRFNLERTVSAFNLLAAKAEHGLV